MNPPRGYRRVRTPTVLQMEMVECGAAALGIVLAHFGRWVPLVELRLATGVSRDGVKALNVVKAGRAYGLEVHAYKKEPRELLDLPLPLIVFWEFNHFLVVEGFSRRVVYLNDPARGPRTVTWEDFDRSFTGVAMTLQPGPDFRRGGHPPDFLAGLRGRLRGSGALLAYVLLATLGLVLPGLAGPIFLKVFVDDVLVGNLQGWLGPLLTGLALAGALQTALTWLQQEFLLRLETRLALTMSGRFLWHVLGLPLEFYSQRYGGEVGSRVALNDRLAGLLGGQLATACLGLISMFFYAALMFHYDARLTLLGILFAGANFAALRWIARQRVDANQKLAQDRGKLAGAAMGGLQIIESIKAGGGEDGLFARLAGQQAVVAEGTQDLAVASNVLTVVPPTLQALSIAAILGAGGLAVMDGRLSLGALVAFISLMSSFIQPVESLVNLGGSLQEVQADVQRLDDVLAQAPDRALRGEPAVPSPDHPPDRPAPDGAQQGASLPPVPLPARLSGHLELRGLTFGYSRLDPPLIENFHLELRPGSRVALVGSTGSGKSTVARLVCGLLTPWAGEILLDGRPRDTWPRRLVTASLALVDQDIFLFEATVRENLTLWDPTLPEAAILRAARDAFIHEEVARRPGGYESRIEEGGLNYSGGERQRLEIARALAGDPSIVVLDEATSALDPLTELGIDANLRRRGCTCLIIAHRLSTIRDCDEILVLEQGRVVQRGTHEQMKDVDGPYARLISAT